MDEKFAALEKYNFWDGNIPVLGYLRKHYTDEIADYIGNKLVKVLVGQRRSGKSYILRQIAHRLIEQGVEPRNILCINKEFTEFDFLGDYKDLEALLQLHRERLKPEGKIRLFIDEIQNIAGLELIIELRFPEIFDAIRTGLFRTGKFSLKTPPFRRTFSLFIPK